MRRTLTAELALDSRSVLGECPRWDSTAGVLRFIDIGRDTLHTWKPAAPNAELLVLDSKVTAFAPTTSGDFVVATEDGFGFLNPADGRVSPFIAVADHTRVRMNDGAVDPLGRFWAGSSSLNHARRDGKLWAFDAQVAPHLVLGGLGMSNGIGWTESGDGLFHVDTLAGTVTAFDIVDQTDKPQLTKGRTLIEISQHDGLPDGLAIDESGAVWLAVWGSGEVRRYTPSGQLDTIVEMGATNPTSCCFGGQNGTTLFVTTARESLRDPTPLDGGVFAVDVGVRGAQTFLFGSPEMPK